MDDDDGFNAATRHPVRDGFTRSSLQVYQTFQRDQRRTGMSQDDQITIVTLLNVWKLSREDTDDGPGNFRVSREDDELLSAAPFTIPVQEFNPDSSSELVINKY